MTERADFFIAAEIFALCKNNSRSIEELTKKIYGNQHSKNITRVYQVMVIFMKQGILVPQFKNRTLTFKIIDGERNGI